jgi:hypothetical protein
MSVRKRDDSASTQPKSTDWDAQREESRGLGSLCSLTFDACRSLTYRLRLLAYKVL